MSGGGKSPLLLHDNQSKNSSKALIVPKNKSVRISIALDNSFSDFADYCFLCGKEFISDLNPTDFVAFRTQYGVSREYVAKIRRKLEEYKQHTINKVIDITSDEIQMTDSNITHNYKKEIDPEMNDNALHLIKKQPTVSNCDYISEGLIGDNLYIKNDEPLSKRFRDVNERLLSTNIIDIGFSTRVRNFFKSKKCYTVAEVLSYSVADLQNVKGLGSGSINNIVQLLDEYLYNPISLEKVKTIHEEKGNILQKFRPEYSVNLKRQVLNMINGSQYDTSEFDSDEFAYFYKCVEAYNDIEKSLCVDCIEKPEYVLELCKVLKEFYTPVLDKMRFCEKIQQDISTLPPDIADKAVLPFIQVYYERHNGLQYGFLSSLNSKVLISDLHKNFDKYEWNTSKKEEWLIISNLLEWLHFDINNIIDNLQFKLDSIKEKNKFIFKMRVEGDTLETVGNVIGLTRERVRQIEDKVIRTIVNAYKINKYDLLAIIYAISGGDCVLTLEVIEKYVGTEFAKAIWYVLSKGKLDCNLYRYFSDVNAVIFCGEQPDTKSIIDIIKSIPDIIETNELKLSVQKLSADHDISVGLLWIGINKIYKATGCFYHKIRITVSFMCDYILRTRFVAGYKIADEFEQKRFCSYLTELFGDKAVMTARAIDAKVSQVGILCDRGKYIHPSYVNVDKLLIEKINEFIEHSPRSVISFSEIFDVMSDELTGTQITNRFYLQGVLNYFGCRYNTNKDYVVKDENVDIADEFNDYIKKYGEVNKSDILEEFATFTDANIGFLLLRCSEVINLDMGSYMHASLLDLKDEDYINIYNYLKAVCSNVPISSRYLLDEFNLRFTDFMIRNNINTHSKLFGILKYMLGDKLHFSRPYIYLEDIGNITGRMVLLHHLEGYDKVSVEKLIDICSQNSIKYMTVTSLINWISPEYIRISKEILMKKELVGVDDNVVIETVLQVQDAVNAYGYRVTGDFDDFSWFPEINTEWNVFVLESILSIAGDLVKTFQMATSSYTMPASIYVSEKYAEDDYNSFLVKLLKEEQDKEPFKSRDEVVNWLQEQRLCNVNMPAFLESEGHLHIDENNRLQVK